MKQYRTLFIFLLLCVCSIGRSQISEKHLQRDIETNKLYAVINGGKILVNEDVITVKLVNKTQKLDGYKVIRMNILDYADLEVPKNIKVEEYVRHLKERGIFEGVYYNTFGDSHFTPNDTNYGAHGYTYFHIFMEDAWDYSLGNPNVKVAVLDSEVGWGHPDLGTGTDGYTNIAHSLGWNYTHNTNTQVSPCLHGTGVAGIIGAKTNNNKYMSGVAGGNHAQGATIIPYCVSYASDSTVMDFSVIDDAILDATNKGVKVINMSFGALYASVGTYPSIDDAISYAYNHGVVLLASTGNDSMPMIAYPAKHPNVIAVGAGKPYAKYDTSNYGTGLDIVAPGKDVYTTSFNNFGYTCNSLDGTSFSTPIVSGIVALMFSVNPNLTPSEVLDILHKTAIKYSGYTYNTAGWCQEIGYGVVNARAAVSAAALELSGPTVISNYAIYTIENMSEDFDAVWTLEDNYYSQNCSQMNYPEINQCYIQRSNSVDMYNKTLTATVKCNNKVVKILTKNIYAHAGFKGTYYNGVTTKTVALPYPLYVKRNTTLWLQSPNLIGATVNHSGNAMVSQFSHDSTIGKVNFYLSSLGTCVITINCDNGDQYGIPFNVVDNLNQLNLVIGDGQIEALLTPVGDEEMLGLDSMDDLSKGEPLVWTLEVYNATTGENVFSREVEGPSFTIDTTGWKPGVYVVRAIIGDEVLNEKVIVK